MSNHVNEELISAYIDEELDSPTRQLVEEALAESDELRRIHAELVEIRAAMGQLPRFELPAGFHERVLQRAEQLRPGRGAVAADAAGGRSLGWSSVAAGLVALAAMVAFAMLWGDWTSEGRRPVVEHPGESGPGETPFDWTQDSIVYYRPESERRPSYSVVVDVTVTSQGRATKAFEAIFNQVGIAFDPDLAIEEELESTFLASRMLAKVEVSDESEEARDEVQMTYVVGSTATIDEIWDRMNDRPADFFPAPTLDLTMMEADRRTMHELNRASRERFARRMRRSQKSLAHRLVFSVSLRSPVRLLGAIPTPSLEANLVPVEPGGSTLPDFELSATPPGETLERAPEDQLAPELDQTGDEISEVLFIVRYPKS